MRHMTRRDVMTLGGAAAVLAAWGRNARATSAERGLGIQLYTVAADLGKDVAGTLRALSRIGYKFVESAGFAKLAARDFHKALDEAGLRCPSCHLAFSASDPGPLFEDAQSVGARYATASVLMPPAPAGGAAADLLKILPTLTLDDFKKIAALANEIGAKAKAAGLQFVYHNHNFEFRTYGDGMMGYEVLLAETDANLVKFELDCGWATAAGQDILEMLRRHPNRFRMLHVKDFVLKRKPAYELFGPDRPTGTELGRGQIDYKPIFAAAQAAGVEYYFSEQEPPIVNMTPLEAARVNFDYMQSL
jgi:sugar phosphate isomerase/epimerase